MPASYIIESIFASSSDFAHIEIVVGKFEAAFAYSCEETAIAVNSGVETIFKKFLCFGIRSSEGKNLYRADLGKNSNEEREELVARAWPVIILSPFFLVTSARQVVEKPFAGDSWQVLLNIVLLKIPGDSRGRWD